MSESAAEDWFVRTTPRPAATVQMLAFPQAGAGCAAFATHARAMPGAVELVTLNLPGRQARFHEPPRTDLPVLVDELTRAAARPRPYVLFGYCSGALLAYLVASELVERRLPLPRRLIVGSYGPPDRTTAPQLAALDSAGLWDELLANNAVPEALARNTELRELSEPAIRADFALVAGYRHRRRPALPIDLTVLRGTRDASVGASAVAGWRHYSSGTVRSRHLASGHWFMEESPDLAVQTLAAEATLEEPGA